MPLQPMHAGLDQLPISCAHNFCSEPERCAAPGSDSLVAKGEKEAETEPEPETKPESVPVLRLVRDNRQSDEFSKQ
jgi:hypothetical protein